MAPPPRSFSLPTSSAARRHVFNRNAPAPITPYHSHPANRPDASIHPRPSSRPSATTPREKSFAVHSPSASASALAIPPPLPLPLNTQDHLSLSSPSLSPPINLTIPATKTPHHTNHLNHNHNHNPNANANANSSIVLSLKLLPHLHPDPDPHRAAMDPEHERRQRLSDDNESSLRRYTGSTGTGDMTIVSDISSENSKKQRQRRNGSTTSRRPKNNTAATNTAYSTNTDDITSTINTLSSAADHVRSHAPPQNTAPRPHPRKHLAAYADDNEQDDRAPHQPQQQLHPVKLKQSTQQRPSKQDTHQRATPAAHLMQSQSAAQLGHQHASRADRGNRAAAHQGKQQLAYEGTTGTKAVGSGRSRPRDTNANNVNVNVNSNSNSNHTIAPPDSTRRPAYQQLPQNMLNNNGTFNALSASNSHAMTPLSETSLATTSVVPLSTGTGPGAAGDTVRRPLLYFAKYGGQGTWALDVFTLPHNAVRAECIDLYNILESIHARSNRVIGGELEEFNDWWSTFEKFLIEYFDFEADVLFPWVFPPPSIPVPPHIDTANNSLLTADMSEVAARKAHADAALRHSLLAKKDVLLDCVRQLNGTFELRRHVDTTDVYHSIVDDVNALVPKLLEYFHVQERYLPDIAAQLHVDADRDAIARQYVAYIRRGESPHTNLVLLARWLEQDMRDKWVRTNVRGYWRLVYRRLERRCYNSHGYLAAKFRKRLQRSVNSSAASRLRRRTEFGEEIDELSFGSAPAGGVAGSSVKSFGMGFGIGSAHSNSNYQGYHGKSERHHGHAMSVHLPGNRKYTAQHHNSQHQFQPHGGNRNGGGNRHTYFQPSHSNKEVGARQRARLRKE